MTRSTNQKMLREEKNNHIKIDYTSINADPELQDRDKIDQDLSQSSPDPKKIKYHERLRFCVATWSITKQTLSQKDDEISFLRGHVSQLSEKIPALYHQAARRSEKGLVENLEVIYNGRYNYT